MGAAAVGSLMVLLDEAAAGDRARGDFLDLQQQSEKVGAAAPEAELVVQQRHTGVLRGASGPAVLSCRAASRRPWRFAGAHFSRNALMRTSYCWASREYTPYASAWISDKSAVCDRTNAGVFDE
jgi:hypothetical protein